LIGLAWLAFFRIVVPVPAFFCVVAATV